MRQSKDLIGKPVITLDEGRFLGNVKDVFLDKDLEWLAGIHLGREGLIRRKNLLIPRGEVAVFGLDAILVKSAESVTDDKETSAARQWLLLDKLQGRMVDTPGGTKVGVVGDVIVDEEARIIGVSLSKVYVEGPIAEQRAVSRTAVVDLGDEDGVMTIDLAKAEQADNEPVTGADDGSAAVDAVATKATK